MRNKYTPYRTLLIHLPMRSDDDSPAVSKLYTGTSDSFMHCTKPPRTTTFYHVVECILLPFDTSLTSPSHVTN